MLCWTLISWTYALHLNILEKLLEEPKSQVTLIFHEPPDICSPLAFSVNETLSFHKKHQNNSCAKLNRCWKLNSFIQAVVLKIFRNFMGVLIYRWRNYSSKINSIYHGSLLPFLINLKTVFWYEQCQNPFLVCDPEN